ncbi:MAG: NAD(P)-dependent alcohol dehydrogenase [Chloroflexota bacterium]|nr:NAD(P)-dependent alcohol dehydrogenase [Chloroflexota bacterium]
MKAIVATGYGAPDVLQLKEVDKPAPKDNEILVRMRASTVNAGDIRMRSFTVPPMFWLPARLTLGLSKPRQPIYGMELAGDVEAIGKDVRRFKVGDQVFASTLEEHFGAHAEYKCLPEDGVVVPKPQHLTYAEAATLSIGAHTALHFLKAGKIQPGHNVLINGASGSVGTFAVQLAKYFGADVTGVCSTRNVGLVQSLGADRVIDYTQADWTKNGETYDIIFDAVGTTTFAQCKRALKHNGYYLHTGMAGAAMLGWWYGMTTGKHVIGGTPAPRREALAFLTELSEMGRLKAVIDRCYPLEQTADAHRYVDTGRKKGNVVITVDQ